MENFAPANNYSQVLLQIYSMSGVRQAPQVSNNYKMFYQLAKDKFPKAQEDKLVYAVNTAAITYDIHYEISTED